MQYLEQIRKILENGKRPYETKPIPEELLTHNQSLNLYDYQKNAVDEFLKHGRSIIEYPTGFGKTFVGMEAMNQIKPRYLIITNKIAIPQWIERIEKYLPNVKKSDYDIMTFQSGVKKIKENEYNLAIIDEAHWSLANTYSEILGKKIKTIMALTASRYRVDGRDELFNPIFVKSIGGDWKNIHNAKYYNPPKIHIWILRNAYEKEKKIIELLSMNKKTVIHCDSIPLGNELSAKFNIPFVNGQTPNLQRSKILNESKNVIVSRVGTEAISIDGIEVGIEIDWHGKSVRQAIQRAGRIMHNKSAIDPQHHIIMTVEEYSKDKDRFSGYYEKGLSVLIHKDDGIKLLELMGKPKLSRRKIMQNVRKLIESRA